MCVCALILFSVLSSGAKFRGFVHLKALKALAEPGEAVGVLAAQVCLSIGLSVCTLGLGLLFGESWARISLTGKL